MRAAVILALVLTAAAARAHAAASTSVTASAYGNTNSQSGTGDIAVGATNHGDAGAGGSCSSSATAGIGVVAGSASKIGCALALPLFQQICNDASAQSSFSDIVHVVSDAPDGTPVTVQATYVVQGHIGGMGTYGYDTHAVVNSTTIPGVGESSGGLDYAVSDSPISASTTVGVGATTGGGVAVLAVCNLDTGTRDCDGGSDYCSASETSWSMTLALSGDLTLDVPVLPAGATYVHLVADSGHDYSVAPASADESVAGREYLSAARPNPTRSSATLDLALTTTRTVNVGVFDLAGRRVATLANGVLAPGLHTLVWDGHDARGGRAAGGVYFVRARGKGLDAMRRVVRLE